MLVSSIRTLSEITKLRNFEVIKYTWCGKLYELDDAEFLDKISIKYKFYDKKNRNSYRIDKGWKQWRYHCST